MKRIFSIISIFLLMFLLQGCLKDNCRKTYRYTYYQPVYKTNLEVRANIKSNEPKNILHAGKLFIYGNYIFLNEIDKGIHVIDNSNPASPRNVAFIDIPGNLDLAVKDNVLYADLYGDLVTLDISNPLNVAVKKYSEGVFPYRQYGFGFSNDTSKIIVDWQKRDTVVSDVCGGLIFWTNVYMDNSTSNSSSGTVSSSSPVGKGGSMARFAVVKNNMYTVSTSDLNVFNIEDAMNPIFTTKINIAQWAIETIFPMADKLFIGSQNGMFIYNISNPNKPTLAGEFSHVRSCDPVIADDSYAYVTLRSGTQCQGFTNQMEVLKLNNITNPELVKTYPFTNPHGLSKDGDRLFICDGIGGLKIYNAADVSDLQLIKQFSGIETYDVIAYNNIALVVAKDGLYQFDYSDVNNIHLISRIGITKE